MKNLKSLLLRWYPLILLVIFAAALRLYRLGQLPTNLHEDEVMTGYVGRFIWLNGKDVYGNPWPLWYFDKFGDFYIILPIYLKGLATFLFGVNEFAIRFPSALLGALSTIPAFFISSWLFKSRKAGYLSALLLAIMPWHIVMSRASAEGVQGIFFYGMGIMFLVRFIHKRTVLPLILGYLFFTVSYWIYHPYRVLVPATLLFLTGIMLIYRDRKKIAYLIIGLVFFTAFTGYISTTKWGSGRFAQTSILTPLSGVQIRLQELIFDEGQQKITTARIFHNKVFGYGREFFRQYFAYFSGGYLFVKGGLSYAYAVPEQGLLYFSYVAALLAAAVYLVRGDYPKENKETLIFVFGLLFIVPIPASLTYIDTPNVHRSIDMTLFLSIFAGYGFFLLFRKRNLRPLAAVLVGTFLLEGAYFWHNYSAHFDMYTSLYRNDGQKALVKYVDGHRKKYDKIILPTTGTMSMYYLYYTNDFSPSYIGKIRYDVRLDHTQNVYFMDVGCPSANIPDEELTKNILVVDNNNCSVNTKKFRQIDDVWGVNKLLDFKVLVPQPKFIK